MYFFAGICGASWGDYAAAWFEHIPEIHPVAALLSSAMIRDVDARAVWDDRMEACALATPRS